MYSCVIINQQLDVQIVLMFKSFSSIYSFLFALHFYVYIRSHFTPYPVYFPYVVLRLEKK